MRGVDRRGSSGGEGVRGGITVHRVSSHDSAVLVEWAVGCLHAGSGSVVMSANVRIEPLQYRQHLSSQPRLLTLNELDRRERLHAAGFPAAG